jgi:hypothetical protein
MKRGKCTPAQSENTTSVIQRPVGMISSPDWQKGWGHGGAGMESEEGTAFEFLPRRSLRDTHLESASVAMDGSPIDGVPFLPFTETAPTTCAVVICLVLSHEPICPAFSREVPQGSPLAFASGNVVDTTDATDNCSITEQHSLPL